MSFITDEMVEAAINAQSKVAECWPKEAMRAALGAAMKAAWRPIEEAPKDGTLVMVRDCFGVQPAYFDADPSLDDFLAICDEGEGVPEYKQYLAENPGLGWVSFGREEVEYLSPTHWMPLPPSPEQEGV